MNILTKKQRRWMHRILTALTIFAIVSVLEKTGMLITLFGEDMSLYAEFALFLIPYLIAGYDVLAKAAHNILHGRLFDENFLMSVATIGAFAMVFFPEAEPHMAEGAAVMLFYQVGELFQSYAVGKSRQSITDLMSIAPDYANIMKDGALEEVDPYDVPVGSTVVIKPGERIPLDGVVIEGSSQLDTAALTGESAPRAANVGDEVISGCVNLSGLLHISTTKPYGESTVQRILELVENAADKKARTESFITRFARWYTPTVVGMALLLAVVPPLAGLGTWSDWLLRGLTFLVVSCPCALVISVPLSFFGGIGGASKSGILIKGSNFLEALAKVDTIVFDKTGTLTNGTFEVAATHPAEGVAKESLIEVAAYAETFSDHPIALSVKRAFSRHVDASRVSDYREIAGRGVAAFVDGKQVLVGNDKLMTENNIRKSEQETEGTALHVAIENRYMGYLVIADMVKPDAAEALSKLGTIGIRKTVMLTGDNAEVARSIATQLHVNEYHAHLLPQDKVELLETLLNAKTSDKKLAFVGDGINDAPVLTRADVGIAMGAMGSDAAIEAADVVLMDDKLANIARAILIAKKTMAIVWQNIIFALGIKFAVLILAALGLANMWLAVFADVGVAVLAILNAMRCMNAR